MITILRYFENKDCTLGIMKVDGLEQPLYTLELPNKNNEQNISCINIGNYIVQPHVSPRLGKCLWLPVVIGRSEILIHAGNKASEIQGCILVGLYSGFVSGEYQVLNSRKAMSLLLEHIIKPTELQIKKYYF